MQQLVVELWDEKELHRARPFPFNDQTTLDHLQRFVHSAFQIESNYQDLFNDNQQINLRTRSSDTLQNIGLKDDSTIIAKHSLLSIFISFKKFLAANPKNLEVKRDIARKVRVLKETLDSAKFFVIYHDLYTDLYEAYAELMRCLNYDPSVIMESVKRHLGAINVKCLPEKKPGGSNAGLIFNYSHEGTTETFYLKANETNWGLNPDARELVVYILLQRIGVGPSKCYFIPNAAQSKSVVYIATLKVPEFTMAKNLLNPMDETAAVELHLLAILLNLTDLNTENFGLNSSGSLCIVDFSLTKNYKDSSCVDHFKEHVRRQPVLVNLDSCPGWKRLQIAKEAINRWDLDRAIDQAEQDFLQLKIEMKEEVAFLDRATGAIKEYLESVKWNVQKLSDAWGEEKLQ